MKTRNGGDEAKTQPVAPTVAASLEPVKTLENMLNLGRRNSWSVVNDRNNRFAFARFNFNGHPPPGTTMLDRI